MIINELRNILKQHNLLYAKREKFIDYIKKFMIDNRSDINSAEVSFIGTSKEINIEKLNKFFKQHVEKVPGVLTLSDAKNKFYLLAVSRNTTRFNSYIYEAYYSDRMRFSFNRQFYNTCSKDIYDDLCGSDYSFYMIKTNSTHEKKIARREYYNWATGKERNCLYNSRSDKSGYDVEFYRKQLKTRLHIYKQQNKSYNKILKKYQDRIKAFQEQIKVLCNNMDVLNINDEFLAKRELMEKLFNIAYYSYPKLQDTVKGDGDCLNYIINRLDYELEDLAKDVRKIS